MGLFTGRVMEIRLNQEGNLTAWIAAPQQAIPAAGQYLLAEDQESVLAIPLFCAESSPTGFLTASTIPGSWSPGRTLNLRGPLGHGFALPDSVQRLALVALGESVVRLLPLASQYLIRGVSVTLVTDLSLPMLPLAIESTPTNALDDILPWADYLVIDLPLVKLPRLRGTLGLPPGERLPCPTQALIMTPMPCGGMADCGVCAVPTRRGWKLACKDGPVFDLNIIEW